mmetsp:Transcript_10046/g.25082  ORF Transcript_10046/g.25082 Transcript_10046/m.25082 type:complete len:206 (+) Transcript_10046:1083-1700(+)
MMSGAWPPPAPSQWYACTVRPRKAAMVCSAYPLSFSVSVWMATCMSYCSATARHASTAAGVAPQSSWIFKPHAPAWMISGSPSGMLLLPLPRSPMFIGRLSVACSIMRICDGAGVHVVALLPVVGPVPPPIMVVMPDASASVTSCGQMKWTCVSMQPAVRIMPSPAMTSVLTPTTIPAVTLSMMSGLPALPMAEMMSPFTPTSAL